MTLGIGFEPAPGIGDGAMLADAGHDILQHAAVVLMIEHIVGGDKRRTVAPAKIGETIETGAIVAGEAAGSANPDATRSLFHQSGEHRFAACPIRLVGDDDEELADGEIFGLEVDDLCG